MAIRAIETRYAGCRFRSRLEAPFRGLFHAQEVIAAFTAARSARFEHGQRG